MEEYNPKIIRILLDHYFCNLNHLQTDQDVLSYYFTLVDLISKDVDISWEEIGEDYIIWQPFEHVNPIDVLENMEDLYNKIKDTLQLGAPNIVINPLEVAAELAEEQVIDYFLEIGENHSYIDDDNCEYFNEDAQEIFEEFYGHILETLYSNQQ